MLHATHTRALFRICITTEAAELFFTIPGELGDKHNAVRRYCPKHLKKLIKNKKALFSRRYMCPEIKCHSGEMRLSPSGDHSYKKYSAHRARHCLATATHSSWPLGFRSINRRSRAASNGIVVRFLRSNPKQRKQF